MMALPVGSGGCDSISWFFAAPSAPPDSRNKDGLNSPPPTPIDAGDEDGDHVKTLHPTHEAEGGSGGQGDEEACPGGCPQSQ